MTAAEAKLIEKLKKLPQHRVAEVVDFVEFLALREERMAAAERLTDSLAKLDQLGLPTITDDDVAIEIASMRQTRRPQPTQ